MIVNIIAIINFPVGPAFLLCIRVLALVHIEPAAPTPLAGANFTPRCARSELLDTRVMFANFELSTGGLVAADVKPKRTRTDLGCLPCMCSSPITQSAGLSGSVPRLWGFRTDVSAMCSLIDRLHNRSTEEEEV